MVKLLHLSDLHIVGNPHWGNMRDAILQFAAENFSELEPGEKLLVLTGDFHNYEQDGYRRASEFLKELFVTMRIDPAEDVFAVPGNHDVFASPDPASQQSRKLIFDYIKSDEKNRDALNEEGDFRNYALPVLLNSYGPYVQFVQKMKIYGESVGNLPVQVHVRTWRDKLRILHLNTTLIADGESKTDQMADTLTAVSDDIKKRMQGDLPCIAIGHNSYKDLTERQQNEELRNVFYYRNISAYLCGDRHKTDDERAERTINLGTSNNAVQIYNIVAPRGSADGKDRHSEFGFLVHEWDENTGDVQCFLARWRSNNPMIKLDKEEPYVSYPFRSDLQRKDGTDTHSGTTKQSDFSLFERHLSDVFREYGYRAEISRLYFAATQMLDTLNRQDTRFVEKADAFSIFKRYLRKTIEETENDWEDLRPGRLERVRKLEELLDDLRAI